jgi:hypothetical protein
MSSAAPQSIGEKSRTQPRGRDRFAVRSNATAIMDTSQIDIAHCRATYRNFGCPRKSLYRRNQSYRLCLSDDALRGG